MANRTSIWPGHECLSPTSLVGHRVILRSMCVREMRRHVGRIGVVMRETDRLVDVKLSDQVWLWWPRSAVIREADHVRCLGIGMAHAKATARMDRFLAWLELRVGIVAVERAVASRSPEHAMLTAAEQQWWPEFTRRRDAGEDITAAVLGTMQELRERDPSPSWALQPAGFWRAVGDGWLMDVYPGEDSCSWRAGVDDREETTGTTRMGAEEAKRRAESALAALLGSEAICKTIASLKL